MSECGCDKKFPTPGPVPCLTYEQRMGACWPPGFLFVSRDPDGTLRLYLSDNNHGRAISFMDEGVTRADLCDIIEGAS